MDEHGSYSMMHGVQGSRMQSIVICQTDRDVLGVLTPRCAHTVVALCSNCSVVLEERSATKITVAEERIARE
eukprot:scaffold114977_cov33-Tisochrysis_lutea.AAC.1